MFEPLQDFIIETKSNIPIITFIINFLLSGLLTFPLSWVYVRYGNSLSNRKAFSKNFIFMSMTTMLIITIIKSSLALSLGLVGALSIIRFRAAIKEPQELAYLFISIAIGLGFGANQGLITIIALIIFMIILIFSNKISSTNTENQNLHLTLNCLDPDQSILDKIVKILKKDCNSVKVKRLDESADRLEVIFSVELENYKKLNDIRKDIKNLNQKINFTFIDELSF